MKPISVILFSMICTACYCQVIDWSKTSNWKIYAVNSNNAFNYPLDSFETRKTVSMNDSTIISFLSESGIWPKKRYAYWMGMYYGSYESGGSKPNKVVFSAYGGFIFDSKSKRYYEMPEGLRKKWSEFLYANLEKVFEE